MTDHLDEAGVARVADGEETAPQHVRECTRCANALLDAMRLKQAVRTAVPLLAPPSSLRQRIAGRRERRPWSYAVAAAAITAIVLTGASFQSRRAAGRELIDLHSTIVGS